MQLLRIWCKDVVVSELAAGRNAMQLPRPYVQKMHVLRRLPHVDPLIENCNSVSAISTIHILAGPDHC